MKFESCVGSTSTFFIFWYFKEPQTPNIDMKNIYLALQNSMKNHLKLQKPNAKMLFQIFLIFFFWKKHKGRCLAERPDFNVIPVI